MSGRQNDSRSAVDGIDARGENFEVRVLHLLELHEQATAYFEEQLKSSEGARAREYLTGRGLKSETIAKFRIGYAPEGFGGLRDRLDDFRPCRARDHRRGLDFGNLKRASETRHHAPAGGISLMADRS